MGMSVAAQFPWPPLEPKLDPKAELRLLENGPLPPAEVPIANAAPGNDVAPSYAPHNDVSQGHARQSELSENAVFALRFGQAGQLESVGRLTGGVAHDFNNLLTGVLLYCDLLLALQPEERVRKYVEEIRNAGIQATGLVRQLLTVARPANCDPCLLSLNDVAEGMHNLLDRLIGENIELQLQLSPSLGLVRMDPTQAQQILLNLVLNARDALPDGGLITVESSACQVQIVSDQILADRSAGPKNVASLPCALLVVADNGAGMDAATKSHVFEAFFTTKPAGKGTGLGLATVHDIVTSNGGLIHVDSAPARGTRITVLLPLVPEAAPHSQEALAPEKIEGAIRAIPPAIEKE